MHSDRNAIEAVQQGDRERFAELVERYQRMVYAISWSYLGDADLCEDAAQECFVKAFRYLRALRNPEKFAGWLASIARNVSATLLRRRRAELQLRERWQAEQPTATASAPGAADTDDKTLRQALGRSLGELPPQHRESLVLFYMEGKSVQEAATLLGISETAMKTRLHRARQVLRSRLEQEIEQTLERLEPRKGFVPALMLLLPAKPMGVASASGSGLAASITGWFGTLLPGLSFMLWMSLGEAAFAYAFLSWFGRLEAANIVKRPENEFRKAVIRRQVRITALGLLFIMPATYLLVAVSVTACFQLIVVYCLWGLWKTMLILRVNSSAYTRGLVLSMFTLALASGLIGFLHFPLGVFLLLMLLLNLVLARTNRDAPRRHDYNLFLRQASGQLQNPESDLQLSRPATEPELRAFGRFLGNLWLVREMSSAGSAVILRLPPVRLDLVKSLTMSTVGDSALVLEKSGSCRARLAPSDAKALKALLGQAPDSTALEEHASKVVEQALALFLEGRQSEASALLSATPDGEIFMSDFSKTRGYRTQVAVGIAAAVFMVGLSLLYPQVFWASHDLRLMGSGEIVNRAEAQQELGKWIEAEQHLPGYPGGDISGPNDTRFELLQLWYSSVPVSLDLVGQENAEAYKRLVSKTLTQGGKHQTTEGVQNNAAIQVLHTPALAYQAAAGPILAAQEIAACGFDSTNVREGLARMRAADRSRIRSPRVTSSTVQISRGGMGGPAYLMVDIRGFAMRAYLLKLLGCLDLLDREDTIAMLVEHQIHRDKATPAGLAPVDPARADGLFHFGLCNLEETWAALWALETLGALSRIDQEACVQGILRFHKGRAVFRSNQSDAGIHIYTNDKSAFHAMGSLERLNALDRIKDFAKWKAHPTRDPRRIGGKLKMLVTASAIESCAFQERLEKLQASMRERKR